MEFKNSSLTFYNQPSTTWFVTIFLWYTVMAHCTVCRPVHATGSPSVDDWLHQPSQYRILELA